MALVGKKDFENLYASFQNVRAVYQSNSNALYMSAKALEANNKGDARIKSIKHVLSDLQLAMASIDSDLMDLKKMGQFSEESSLRRPMSQRQVVECLSEVLAFVNEASKSSGESTKMSCNECGAKFKKKLSKKTSEVKCPKCGGYDTEPE